MIDCPVASIGSTSNKYFVIKISNLFNTDFKVIIVMGWYLDADIKPF
jgi:hypothetical protein